MMASTIWVVEAAPCAIARATAANFGKTKGIFELRYKGGVVSQVEIAQVESQYQQALAAIQRP